MAVEVTLRRDFLERLWKLMRICLKIRHTMSGRARVIIENSQCDFISIHGEALKQKLALLAQVSAWSEFRCLWMPRDVLVGELGDCRLMAGMRWSRTVVDEEGFWFEGSDGADQVTSVRLSREWVRQELNGEPHP